MRRSSPLQNKHEMNQLYYGDNLEILRAKIARESVDLCYIDPPFNSKRNYFQIYTNQGHEDRAQTQAFLDTWEWGEEAIEGLEYLQDIKNLNNGTLTFQTVALIKGLHAVLGEGDLFAYLVHMTLRIVEIHRVLKPTGSFYLHCDPTASHYLKLILDTVFCSQGGDFRNEIIWLYDSAGRSKNDFNKKHDTIFRYTKSKNWIFNGTAEGVGVPRAASNHMRVGKDDEGRAYYEKTDKASGKVYRWYLDEKKIRNDWWEDIEANVNELSDSFFVNALNREDRERLGYPTQKPESLLERIIKASSNEGDVVLDAYCGCGTTVAVAQRLNRKWIGIDITFQSISLIMKRFEDTFEATKEAVLGNIHLDGVPKDIESAKALATRKDDKTRKEFEKWALLTYSNNQAIINPKKGADGGIDGLAFFKIDFARNVNGKAVFQVKSGGANRATIATLNSDRLREKAEMAFLITLDEPTKPMRQEAQGIGRYKHPTLNREEDCVQIITIAQILAGERLNLPMGRNDMVKAAQALEDETVSPKFL